MTRPNAIRTIGLKTHLEKTKSRHNDKGYTEFIKYIQLAEELDEKPSVTKMARAFGVMPTTMEKWLIIYREEKNNDQI